MVPEKRSTLPDSPSLVRMIHATWFSNNKPDITTDKINTVCNRTPRDFFDYIIELSVPVDDELIYPLRMFVGVIPLGVRRVDLFSPRHHENRLIISVSGHHAASLCIRDDPSDALGGHRFTHPALEGGQAVITGLLKCSQISLERLCIERFGRGTWTQSRRKSLTYDFACDISTDPNTVFGKDFEKGRLTCARATR